MLNCYAEGGKKEGTERWLQECPQFPVCRMETNWVGLNATSFHGLIVIFLMKIAAIYYLPGDTFSDRAICGSNRLRLAVQPDVQCYGAVMKACANAADATGAGFWMQQLRPSCIGQPSRSHHCCITSLN